MWIFTSLGFISIVRHTDKPGILIVRSRFKGHIEKIFPKALVEEDANRDYRFRVQLPIKEVAKVISRLVAEICYDNFKACLEKDNQGYHESCVDTYYVVAKDSGNWDLDNFIYGRRESDEKKQVKGTGA